MTMTKPKRAAFLTFLAGTLIAAGVAPAAAKKPSPPAPEPVPTPACESPTTLSGTGGLNLECAWAPTDEGVSTGTVAIDVIAGEVSYLVIAVRDSSPGDYCTGPTIWNTKPLGSEFSVTFDLDGYWDSPTDWCGTDRTDTNGDPLFVSVYARVKRGTVLEVTIDPPQAP